MDSLFRGSLAAAVLLSLSGGAQAATVLYNNNFSSNTNGFSGVTGLTTSPSGQSFLGPLYNGGTATLTLNNVAPNSAYTLNFTLYAIGSVDGDGQFGGGPDPFVVTSSAGGTIFNYNFANFDGDTQNYPTEPSPPATGAAAIGTLGYSGYPGTIQDSTYNFSVSGTTGAGNTLSFSFSGQTNEALNNEFYGLDNVSVSGTTAVSAVPLPASAPLFGAGLVMLAGLRYAAKRRKQATAV